MHERAIEARRRLRLLLGRWTTKKYHYAHARRLARRGAERGVPMLSSRVGSAICLNGIAIKKCSLGHQIKVN